MKIIKGEEVVRVKKLDKKAVVLEVLEKGKAAKVHIKDGSKLAFDPVYREYELERVG